MRNRSTLAMSSLVLLLLGQTLATATAQQQRPKPPCCFNNPQFAGTCTVEPATGETCSSVLAYLNNPKAAGKSYCNNTTIRGGWKSAGCKPAR